MTIATSTSLMTDLAVAHEYQGGPAGKHDRHSGWVAEAAERLLGPPAREGQSHRTPTPGLHAQKRTRCRLHPPTCATFCTSSYLPLCSIKLVAR
jgi:hypothetical protein